MQTDEAMQTSELTQLQMEKLLDMQTAGSDMGPIKQKSYLYSLSWIAAISKYWLNHAKKAGPSA